MSNGPCVVLLKVDNAAAFVERLSGGGRERVTVDWSRRSDGVRTRAVRPARTRTGYLFAGGYGGERACLAVYHRAGGGRDEILPA